jgi:crotonobetainyl-CoA:carnitine CoA-transferase CaiB-like acyl-CoA transferase
MTTSTAASAERYVLEGLRVLDYTDGVAGPYCSKLLADAGADVVKVESDGEDPLRFQGSGALFEFLNASKRSVTRGDVLAPEADVILSHRPADMDRLRQANHAAVIVTITPFGCQGPWVGRPWTEFTLQAACGSTGQRGLPERPPLAAGGRIGEWAAGTFAAVAALAAHREALRSGRGEDVDVAILDCMAVTMVTYPSVYSSFLGWPPLSGTGRTVEVPSIEPTSDGYFVVTTNSAQQFQDFLVMMGRPDLLEDHELAQVAKRFARREEFLRAVHNHTSERTTSGVLEEAALFRIPAAPVLDAEGVLGFEQFRDRDVLVPSSSGRFVQPRVPYRISGLASRAFTRAPAPGEHEGVVAWPARPGGPPTSLREWQLPLAGTRVIDCTAWWAGPSATNVLAALGADVIKVESVGRPDQMRLVSARRPPEDQWWEWGPIFHAVNIGKRGVTVDLGSDDGVEVFRRLLGTADVLLENYTPRVMEQFGLTWDSVHALNPELVMVRMPAFGLDGPWRDRTGFAQTMESVSGMAWRTGFPDGPPTLVRGACDPIAGMHAVIAALLALRERDRSGLGSHVESVMVEAALNVAAEQLVEFSASGEVMGRLGNRGPTAAPQGVYRCNGDDRWVAIAVETDAQWSALVRALGEPNWAPAEELARAEGRHEHHDAIDRWLEAWTEPRDAEDIVDELSSSGVPAEAVIAARDIVDNPQLQWRSLFETEDHPVTGVHEVPMLPFRFARVERWLRRPSPSLGQHNDEVLADLGVGIDERELLRKTHVIGDRLAGA